MVKFKVSPRSALMLAMTYSVIYMVFGISMMFATILFIEAGFYWLAAAANAILMVPSALFVLIWREYGLLKSKKHQVSVAANKDLTVAIPVALIGTWKLLKNFYRSLKSK